METCRFEDLNRGLNWRCLTHNRMAVQGRATTRPVRCSAAPIESTDLACPDCGAPLYLDPSAERADGEPVWGGLAACSGCEFVKEFEA